MPKFAAVVITCGDLIMPLLFAAPTALRLLLLDYSSTHIQYPQKLV